MARRRVASFAEDVLARFFAGVNAILYQDRVNLSVVRNALDNSVEEALERTWTLGPAPCKKVTLF
jgi:hypothetical protein